MKKLTLFLAAVAAFCMCVQAQEVRYGVIEVGDYNNASEIYNSSYFDMAPTNFYLAHTGAQLLFTPDLLADMEGKENVKIDNLKFKFYCESYEELIRDVKIYLQEIDATEFSVNEDGVKQFFHFEGLNFEDNYIIDLLDYYGEDVELSFPFTMPAPFAFTPGKSLLVTIVFDAHDYDNCTMGSDYAPFYTSGIRGKAMTYTNNWTSFLDYASSDDFPNATVMQGCGTNVELPVTLIEYSYTEAGPALMRGDVNGDSKVDVADVTLLISYILGNPVENFYIEVANCNPADDNIDVSDVTALINYVLNGVWLD